MKKLKAKSPQLKAGRQKLIIVSTFELLAFGFWLERAERAL